MFTAKYRICPFYNNSCIFLFSDKRRWPATAQLVYQCNFEVDTCNLGRPTKERRPTVFFRGRRTLRINSGPADNLGARNTCIRKSSLWQKLNTCILFFCYDFSAFFGYVKTNSRRNSGARFKFDGLRLDNRCVYHLSFYYHMFCDDIAAMVMVVGYNPTQKLLYSSSRHGRKICFVIFSSIPCQNFLAPWVCKRGRYTFLYMWKIYMYF